MKSLAKMTIAAAAVAGGVLTGLAPANAQVDIGVHLPGVHVGVGVGGPPAFYALDFIRPAHAMRIITTMTATAVMPFTTARSY